MTRIDQGTPQWTILGAAFGTGVLVMASTTLTDVELRADVEEIMSFATEERERLPVCYTLRASMSQVQIVYGADYGEALANLFRQWSPDRYGPHEFDPAVRRALRDGPKAIE